jgi:hypothetical protein
LRDCVDFVLADTTPAAVMWGEDLTVRDHLAIPIDGRPTRSSIWSLFRHATYSQIRTFK